MDMKNGKRWRPTGTALTRRGQVLAVAGDDVARRGGAGVGEVAHLRFGVRVGVRRGKLAGDKVLGFRESLSVLESGEVRGWAGAAEDRRRWRLEEDEAARWRSRRRPQVAGASGRKKGDFRRWSSSLPRPRPLSLSEKEDECELKKAIS
jgi:hypothetical protein